MMRSWKSLTQPRRVLSALQPPSPGVHHFMLQRNEKEKSRVHLRIEEDGSGLILINARHLLHLNPTAVFMAALFLQKVPAPDAVLALTARYEIEASQARTDFEILSHQLQEMIFMGQTFQLYEALTSFTQPFSARLSAPYRMDLAITYRCNNECAHCYNARSRHYPELDTDQWKQIIDRLWEDGIPHIIFTGGEPTLRPDLPALIAHAEGNGQITGINTNGRRLKDPAYVQQLVEAGLDHVQITLESHDAAIHDPMVSHRGAWQETVDGIRNVLATPSLYMMTNTTMLNDNVDTLAQTLDFLAGLGVPTVGLNALIYSGKGKDVGSGLDESALPPLLTLAQAKTEANQQKLIWYTPTQYCNFDPERLDLGVKGCTAAFYNMCTEPNGDVIPCQAYYDHVLGNMLKDKWENIWEHPTAVAIRERKEVPAACHDCHFLHECGGGCPLARQSGRMANPTDPYDPLQGEGKNGGF